MMLGHEHLMRVMPRLHHGRGWHATFHGYSRAYVKVFTDTGEPTHYTVTKLVNVPGQPVFMTEGRDGVRSD